MIAAMRARRAILSSRWGMPKLTPKMTTLLLAAAAGAAWAGWSDVHGKADQAKQKGDEVHKAVAPATKKIVAAMCAASDDNRKSAGTSAASDARSSLQSKLDAFHRATADAIVQLEPVSRDSKDGNHGSASSLISELKSRQSKIDEETRALANGSPPVIDYIVRKSESARSDRRGRCSERDLSLGSDRVSCLVRDGETCTALEIAFDNSSSISSARDRASHAKEAVEREIKRSSPSSSVAKCKRVEVRVDCFKVCPDIDDDGKYRESSPSWRERCS